MFPYHKLADEVQEVGVLEAVLHESGAIQLGLGLLHVVQKEPLLVQLAQPHHAHEQGRFVVGQDALDDRRHVVHIDSVQRRKRELE
jgi:hypothetical protein